MLKKQGWLLLLLSFFTGCASYKQNIMFKTGSELNSTPLKDELLAAESNYQIKKNDQLSLRLYSNNGEKLIDPNPEVSQQSQNSDNAAKPLLYLVDQSGLAKFPMINEIKLEGLSIQQAEMILQKEYEKFFKAPFVKLKFENKRFIILGAPGGQVLPLENENVSLVEALALAKGIDNTGKAQNIRVLRGNEVVEIDLTTIDGYRKGNIKIEPGDIIYVEPVRRPFSEGFREFSPVFTILASVTTLIAVLTR